ncbi:MAG TPA: cupredoxin domain-containing protein [Longimicrobiaceae bacterium]
MTGAPRRHPAHAAALLVAAALALAGCAGGRNPERHTVEIRNFVFTPARVAVREGDEVTFVNHDAVPHTATAADGSWDTGNIPANGSAVVRVKGTGAYKCTFHPTMTGELTVAK